MEPDISFPDVSNIEKPPGIPGFIGKTKLPAVIHATVHEQDDGTIVSVCATGKYFKIPSILTI